MYRNVPTFKVHCFMTIVVINNSFLPFLATWIVLNPILSCMGSETKILESMMKFWNDSEWTQAEQGVFGPIAWTGPRLCPMACSNRPASGPSVRRHRLPIDIYDPSNTVGIQSSDVHRDRNTSLFTCVKTMGRNKQVSCKGSPRN